MDGSIATRCRLFPAAINRPGLSGISLEILYSHYSLRAYCTHCTARLPCVLTVFIAQPGFPACLLYSLAQPGFPVCLVYSLHSQASLCAYYTHCTARLPCVLTVLIAQPGFPVCLLYSLHSLDFLLPCCAYCPCWTCCSARLPCLLAVLIHFVVFDIIMFIISFDYVNRIRRMFNFSIILTNLLTWYFGVWCG